MVEETDKAWLAGLFDGEGSLNFTFRSNHGCPLGAWSIRARISNTHEPTIARVAILMRRGYIRSIRREGNKRPVFNWEVHALSAELFLELILSYSVTKCEQIKLALAASRLRRTAPRIRRGLGNGRGAPTISPETHARLREMSDGIKALNGHVPLRLFPQTEMITAFNVSVHVAPSKDGLTM